MMTHMVERKIVGMISFECPSDNSNQLLNGKYNDAINVKVRIVQASKSNKNKLNILKNLRRHLNIQHLLTFELQDDRYYVAIKSYYITLNKYFESSVAGRKFNEKTILIRNITEGLKYLHKSHIVHGNICPSNIGIENGTDQAVLCKIGFNTLFDKVSLLKF